MDRLPENISSKYKFVTVAARRCAQLLNGARPKIDDKLFVKSTTVAINEVLQGKIEFIDDPEKARKEAEAAAALEAEKAEQEESE